MSATASGLQVKIDPALVADRKLESMIEVATAFFEEQLDKMPPDSRWSNPSLTWDKASMHSGSMRVNYRERHSDDIGVVHQIEFPIRYLFDEYARESAMRDLMSQVRAQRSRIIAKEISRLIGELEEEEAGG